MKSKTKNMKLVSLLAVLSLAFVGAGTYSVAKVSAEALDTESELATIVTGIAEANGVEYETFEEALAAGDSVKLLRNTKVGTFTISGRNVEIDLNGKTLTLTTRVFMNSDADVTIKNGSICITGAVAGGDALICVGNYSTNAKLTLDNVYMSGYGYNSAYAVMYVYGSSTLDITGSKFILQDEQHGSGGFIKAQSGKNGVINITGTDISLKDAKIGFLDGTLTLDGVDLDI